MKIKLGLLGMVLICLIACSGGDSGSTDDEGAANNGAASGTIDASAEVLADAGRETTAQILASESDIAGYSPAGFI